MLPPETYSVFVRFRKGRLALRRGMQNLGDALVCAEKHRATRFYQPDDVFIAIDGTPVCLSIADARRAESVERARLCAVDAEERDRRSAALVARAERARQRAILACERARTVFTRAELPPNVAPPLDADHVADLVHEASSRMLRSIAIVESLGGVRLGGPISR